MDQLACAIDLGTSSAKLVLVDLQGRVVASRAVSYSLQAPRAGWAETDPQHWLRAVDAGLRSLLDASPGPVVAVGLDGQMHGVVVGSGPDALRPAMLWPDSRALDELERWRELPESVRAPLANPLAPGMFGPLLAWLARHEPQILARAQYACSPKDWLRSQFTADTVVTDASDASATLAWDVPGHRWHTELLAAVGVPTRLLPEVVPSGTAVRVRRGVALPEGVPMSVGCADTAATLLATQLQPGEVLVNLGTGIQVCMAAATVTAVAEPHCHTFARADGGWYSMVAPQNGGLALNHVGTLLAADWGELYASLDTEPAPDSPVSFAPWFSPDRLPRLRSGDAAGWQGIGLATSRADLLRASLEAIAFQVAQALAALPGDPVVMRFTGGGTRDPRMRQLVCDAVGLPARRSTVSDATALGAALLGFRTAGLDPKWPVPREEELIEPRRDPALDGRRQRFNEQAAQQLDL